MGGEPLPRDGGGGVLSQLPHFVGQGMGDDVKRAVLIVGVDSSDVGLPTALRCQGDEGVSAKTLRQELFCLFGPLHACLHLSPRRETAMAAMQKEIAQAWAADLNEWTQADVQELFCLFGPLHACLHLSQLCKINRFDFPVHAGKFNCVHLRGKRRKLSLHCRGNGRKVCPGGI